MEPRVTGIDLDVTLDPDAGSMRLLAKVKLEASGVSSFLFGLAEGLSLEQVRASSGLVDARKAGSRIRVQVAPPLEGTRTLTFQVSGRPRRGEDLLVRPDRVVLGPRDAWYPSFPGTWAEVSVIARVPEGWTVVAPGRPAAESGTGPRRWTAKRPIRAVALVAAPGLVLGETPLLQTTLRTAAPKNGPSADEVAVALTSPMGWLAGALAPYPFDGFNLVILPGLEHRIQAGGMVVISDVVPISGPSDGADLLAGQWFGERIAGDGIWIDALAAWEATVFTRDRGLPLPAEIARLREAYFRLPSGADRPISSAHPLTPEAVIRGKGSAVPDMIRLGLTDRDFFGAVRALFARPVSEPLTLAGLRAVFEEQTDRNLLREFSDWFDRTGAPSLGGSMRTMKASGGGYRVDLELNQLRGLYALPVEVVFIGPTRRHRERVEIDAERTSVFYVLEFEPTRFEIDPGERLFRWPAAASEERRVPR